ncbi:POTRA domain-containing protein, partial [Leptospira sp. 96542]|nr:POTRA domain-containing protein [Leptospira sp. 96542]
MLEIPPLVERSLSPGEGPRIQVTRFELQDARDLPRHGIQIAEVRGLLDQALREQQADGFTIGEMEAVTNRVTNYYRQRGLILAKAVLPVQTVTDGIVTLQIIEGHLGQVLSEGNGLYSTRTLARPFHDLLGEPVSQQEAESALLTPTDYPGLAVFGTFQPGNPFQFLSRKPSPGGCCVWLRPAWRRC